MRSGGDAEIGPVLRLVRCVVDTPSPQVMLAAVRGNNKIRPYGVLATRGLIFIIGFSNNRDAPNQQCQVFNTCPDWGKTPRDTPWLANWTGFVECSVVESKCVCVCVWLSVVSLCSTIVRNCSFVWRGTQSQGATLFLLNVLSAGTGIRSKTLTTR